MRYSTILRGVLFHLETNTEECMSIIHGTLTEKGKIFEKIENSLKPIHTQDFFLWPQKGNYLTLKDNSCNLTIQLNLVCSFCPRATSCMSIFSKSQELQTYLGILLANIYGGYELTHFRHTPIYNCRICRWGC